MTVTREPVSQIREFLHQHPQYIRNDENRVVSPTPFKGNNESMVNVISYNMEKSLSSSVDKYCSSFGRERGKLRRVPTPFTDESKEPQGFVRPPTAKEKDAESKCNKDYHEPDSEPEPTACAGETLPDLAFSEREDQGGEERDVGGEIP